VAVSDHQSDLRTREVAKQFLHPREGSGSGSARGVIVKQLYGDSGAGTAGDHCSHVPINGEDTSARENILIVKKTRVAE
jgi:hypothetical protein